MSSASLMGTLSKKQPKKQSSHQKLSVSSCRKHDTSKMSGLSCSSLAANMSHQKLSVLSSSNHVTNWAVRSHIGCTATFEHKLAILNYQARLKKVVIQTVLQKVMPHPCAQIVLRHPQLPKKTVAPPRISCQLRQGQLVWRCEQWFFIDPRVWLIMGAPTVSKVGGPRLCESNPQISQRTCGAPHSTGLANLRANFSDKLQWIFRSNRRVCIEADQNPHAISWNRHNWKSKNWAILFTSA